MVKLVITTSDRRVDVIGSGVDCVIRAGEPEDSTSLAARRLGGFQWLLCAAPSYLEAFGEPRTLDDLRSHRFVGYEPSGSELFSFRCGEKSLRVEPASWLTLDETEGYIGAGLHGLGLIRAADFLLRDHVARGRLRRLLPDAEPMATSLHLVHAHSMFPPASLRAFRDWARESLSDG